MRLVINAVRLTRPFTGVGRYLVALLREWSGMELPFDEITLVAPRPLHETAVFPRGRYRLAVQGLPGPDPLWERLTLGPRARGSGGLLFSPSYTLPLGYAGPAVVTYFGPSTNAPSSLEGLRALLYDRLHRASARRARRVITASRVAEQRVVGAYGVPADRVSVIPLAADPGFAPVEDAERTAGVRRRLVGGDEPFLLFVGKLSGRHSIPVLLQAYVAAWPDLPGAPRLLLVGPDVLGLGVAAWARELGIGDRVVHVSSVPEDDLPSLYSEALAFVFPADDSEGFGLPLVEAMACGAPVLSTSRGSVPEVTADAALLVQANDVATWTAALRRLAGDAALRGELRRRGLARARGFSWRATAQRTMEVLSGAANATMRMR